MSYVLHIWEQPPGRPVPVSVEEADRLLGELRATQPGQNPKFIAFAQHLTHRFPCICSAEAEDIPESEWAWSDGPLDGLTGSAVYSIGLNSGRVDEVQPFVVKSANELKLNVMDEQAGAVYLADGAVLATPNRVVMRTTPNDADVPTAAELEKILFEALKPLLTQYGFKGRKRDSFRRVFPGGWQEIEITTGDDYSPRQVGFAFSFIGRLDAVTELMASVLWPWEKAEEVKSRITMGCHLTELIKGSASEPGLLEAPVIRSHAEIDGVVKHVLTGFRVGVLPMLDKCRTVEGYEVLLNSLPLAKGLFTHSLWDGSKHILTAYLTSNPNLDLICREFEERNAPYPKSDDAYWTRKSIEYVRSQIQSKQS